MCMLKPGCKFFSRINRKFFIFILFFVAGLFAGITLGIKEDPYDPIIFQIHITDTSFFLCLFSQFIPILICIITIFFSLDFVYYLLLFFDSLCRGYCGAIVLSSFRSCAWLVRSFILFPGVIGSVLMIWLLIKHSNGRQKSLLCDFLLALFLLCITAALNTFIFSSQYNPFVNFL